MQWQIRGTYPRCVGIFFFDFSFVLWRSISQSIFVASKKRQENRNSTDHLCGFKQFIRHFLLYNQNTICYEAKPWRIGLKRLRKVVQTVLNHNLIASYSVSAFIFWRSTFLWWMMTGKIRTFNVTWTKLKRSVFWNYVKEIFTNVLSFICSPTSYDQSLVIQNVEKYSRNFHAIRGR